jgi:hypothetical protein
MNKIDALKLSAGKFDTEMNGKLLTVAFVPFL